MISKCRATKFCVGQPNMRTWFPYGQPKKKSLKLTPDSGGMQQSLSAL